MTRTIGNVFMTIRSLLTLRNLLAVLCAAALIAVIVKGFRIEEKIGQVRQADAYYGQNLRISAEAAYAAAQANTVIRYREDHIRERLAELAPVTRLREELLKSKSELLTASENGDFEAFLSAYETYDLFRSQSLESGFAAEYRELNDRYELEAAAGGGFAAFRSGFGQALAANLESGDYGDESAKWSLLRIPAAFFADENAANADTAKSDALNDLFRDYDERKLKKLAAAGRYAEMLSEAKSTLAAYAQNGFEAPWVQAQAEETTRAVLRKDLDAEAYPAFAAHARGFADFASQTGLASDLTAWIGTRIGELADRARSLVADSRFEEAISLYKALSGYSDMQDEIAQAEEAWTEEEPLRMLQAQDPAPTYSLAISGKNRFGAELYVAALDENGTLYFAAKNGSSVAVSSTPQIMAGYDVLGLGIEESLSDGRPVILAESASTSRKAVYTALLLQDSSFAQMFQIDADGYAIEDDGQTLRADNPADAGEEGQTAVYVRYGDVFSFDRFEGGTLDIGGDDPALYPRQRVRALLTVIEAGYGQALARTADGSEIVLRGGFDFEPGTYEVTGTFEGEYEQFASDAAAPSEGVADTPEEPEAAAPETPGTEEGTDEPSADGSGAANGDDPDTGTDGIDPDADADDGEASAGDSVSNSDSAAEPAAPSEPETPAGDSPPPTEPTYRSVPVFAVETLGT